MRDLAVIAAVAGLFLLAPGGARAFNLFGTPKAPAAVANLKNELVQRAEQVNRGLDASPEQREAITALVEQLEKRNPTKRCVHACARACARLFRRSEDSADANTHTHTHTHTHTLLVHLL